MLACAYTALAGAALGAQGHFFCVGVSLPLPSKLGMLFLPSGKVGSNRVASKRSSGARFFNVTCATVSSGYLGRSTCSAQKQGRECSLHFQPTGDMESVPKSGKRRKMCLGQTFTRHQAANRRMRAAKDGSARAPWLRFRLTWSRTVFCHLKPTCVLSSFLLIMTPENREHVVSFDPKRTRTTHTIPTSCFRAWRHPWAWFYGRVKNSLRNSVPPF